jgi:pyruvate,orthophosphate dikinase
MACDMVKEKLIDEKKAIRRIPAGDLSQLCSPAWITPAARRCSRKKLVLTIGLPASPGAAVGKLAFTAEEAVERCSRWRARDSRAARRRAPKTSTACTRRRHPHQHRRYDQPRGGRRSRLGSLLRRRRRRNPDRREGQARSPSAARPITHNDIITIDGSTGEVLAGAIATMEPKLSGDFATVMKWADKYRTLGPHQRRYPGRCEAGSRVRRRRDWPLPHRAHVLRRRSHRAMREMILADGSGSPQEGSRQAAAAPAEGLHRHLHRDEGPAGHDSPAGSAAARILAARRQGPGELAKELNVSPAFVKNRVAQLHEQNPMLGHRGCRLAVTYPEILDMQVTAIVEAAIMRASRRRSTLRSRS